MCMQAFYATDDKGIAAFINEYLDKYEVIDTNQISYTTNNAYINVTIIYNIEVFDKNDRELLKEIIKLDHISINNAQSKLNIGFNRVSILINLLENKNIISSKEDCRKLLMGIDEANSIIDSIEKEINMCDFYKRECNKIYFGSYHKDLKHQNKKTIEW